MKKLLIKLLLLLLINIQSFNANTQNNIHITPVLRDSLQYLLNYFYHNTNDGELQQALEEATQLLSDTMNNALALELIKTERQLSDLIQQNMWLNYEPFNKQQVLSYCEMVKHSVQDLSPKKNNRYYAAALNNLGHIYEDIYQKSSFLYLFEQAEAIKKNLSEEDSVYAEILMNEAENYERKENYGKAFFLLRKAENIIKASCGENNICYASYLRKLAHCNMSVKNYNGAIFFYEHALAVQKKIFGEESSLYALYVYYTAERGMDIWQYQKAFTLYLKAADITKRALGTQSRQYAYCLEGIGSYYYNMGDYDTAVSYYLRSLDIKEKLFGKDYYDNALTLHNLATTYVRMGWYEKALPMFEEVFAIHKIAPRSPENYAYELNWAAFLYQIVGQYDKAFSLCNQALQIAKKRMDENCLRYAKILNTIALTYERMDKYESALELLLQERSVIKQLYGEDNPEYAACLDNIGTLYMRKKRFTSSQKLFLKALDTRKKTFGENHPYYAETINHLGDLYLLMHKYDSAKILLEQSLSIRKKVLGDEHPDYAKNLSSLALLDIAMDDYEDASVLIMNANNIVMKYIRRCYSALSEEEKMNLINEEAEQFNYLPSLLYSNNISNPKILQQVYANELILKGMVLEDQQRVLKNIRKSKDTANLNVYSKWYSNKRMLGEELLLSKQKKELDIDSLEDITNQLEQQLSRLSSSFDYEQKIQSVTAKDIAEKLKDDEASIEFLRFKVYNKKWTDSIMYAAMILFHNDSVPRFVPLCEEKQLQQLLDHPLQGSTSFINILYGAIENKNRQSEGLNDSLYSLVWKPLEKYLQNIHTIYYAPVGLLNVIAFKALAADPSRMLIDKYQLNQLLCTRSLAFKQTEIQKPDSASIWANIKYDTYEGNVNTAKFNSDTNSSSLIFQTTNIHDTRGTVWMSLPGTKQEMDSISKVLINNNIKISLVSDTLASEEYFKLYDGKSPSLLHIATHGFFYVSRKNETNNNSGSNTFKIQRNAMFRNGLVLAGANAAWKGEMTIPEKEDGILTAYEIAQMDLSNTELVVLSACETARGDLHGDEGVIGLQRAFKMAGVKQIIMSLWKVHDQQTAELMTLFYRNWLNGQSTKEALRSAQLIMKKKYSPIDWAGFVLVE